MEDEILEEEFSKQNIGDEWIKALFKTLKKCQDLERVCRVGSFTINQEFNINPQFIATFKFERLVELVTELNFFIDDIKKKIEHKLSNKLLKEFEICKNSVYGDYQKQNNNPDKILFTNYNPIHNIETMQLTSKYTFFLNKLSFIRARLTNICQEEGIFFPKEEADNYPEELNKMKKLKWKKM